MLQLGEVNPLAVFGIRQLEHCPPHFTVVDFDIRTHEKAISDWIWTNLSGRFYVGNRFVKSAESDRKVTMVFCAAFEIPSEASYFSLLLDQINT